MVVKTASTIEHGNERPIPSQSLSNSTGNVADIAIQHNGHHILLWGDFDDVGTAIEAESGNHLPTYHTAREVNFSWMGSNTKKYHTRWD